MQVAAGRVASMPRLLLVTLWCVLASVSSEISTTFPGVGERLHGKKPAGSGARLRNAQLKAVLSWHCAKSAASQTEDKPCKNFRCMHRRAGLKPCPEPR